MEDTTMLKKIIIAFSTAIVVAASAGPAMAARYCAIYTGGGINCGFFSLQQCQSAVRGAGGHCSSLGR
jgi:hypothetical protein